jgi:hypothetical protein
MSRGSSRFCDLYNITNYVCVSFSWKILWVTVNSPRTVRILISRRNDELDMRQVRQDNKCIQKFGKETSQETSTSNTEEIGYRPNDQEIDVRFPAEAEIFISQTNADYLWGPLTVLPSGYRWSFPRGHSGQCLTLTHLHQSPKLNEDWRYGCIRGPGLTAGVSGILHLYSRMELVLDRRL